MRVVIIGAMGMVHLAWAIQAGRAPARMRAINIDGTARVLDAVVAAGVAALVYASSVGAYFQPEAAAAQRRYFAGPLLPRTLLRRGVLPVVPHLYGLRFQAVHAEDVARAYLRTLRADVRGAFNVAAEPVLTTADGAELHAVLRGIADGTSGPTPPLRGASRGRAVVDAARTGMGARMSGDLRARAPRPHDVDTDPAQGTRKS